MVCIKCTQAQPYPKDVEVLPPDWAFLLQETYNILDPSTTSSPQILEQKNDDSTFIPLFTTIRNTLDEIVTDTSSGNSTIIVASETNESNGDSDITDSGHKALIVS